MTLTMWRDNRLPQLTDTITTESDGAAVNLAGRTVTFSMRDANSAALKISAASATVVSAADGEVSYGWTAADVDTVGDYLCWWTVTTSGLTQDTPEFEIAIQEHAPDPIVVTNPVGSGGATSIIQGDSYLNADGRALMYELQVMDAPDITGLTLTYRVEGELEKTMTVVGEDGARVDLTSAETAALTIGTHLTEIEATVSPGNFATLMRSTITVADDLDGP
jgi:hypothetical protein